MKYKQCITCRRFLLGSSCFVILAQLDGQAQAAQRAEAALEAEHIGNVGGRITHPVALETATQPAAQESLALVQPVLNGRELEDAIFIVQQNGELYLPADFLAENGIGRAGEGIVIQGQRFSPAAANPSMRASLDEKDAVVRIACSADCFRENRLLARRNGQSKPSPVAPGGFINYDLFAQIGDRGDIWGGFAEAGLFTNAGTGLASAVCSSAHADAACIRLETSWTIDNPQTAQRLRIGDAITQAAPWGAPARFGGVRWGTDFSLQPDFITFPTPTLSGEAALPGAVEIFIRDARRFESGLPAGPFSISELPVVTGAGSAQVVVTDLLGRETVISTDYYAAPQLLKPGLAQYSVEAGFLREDFGLRSNAYGDAFIAGGYSRGLTNWMTAGVRSELSADHQTAGAAAAFADAGMGVLEFSAAMSNVDGSAGALVDIRHEWRSSSFSIGGAVSYATEHFQRFGQIRPAARVTARSFASYSDSAFGSASVNWIYRDERSDDDFSAVGFRYARSFRRVSVNCSALRTIEPQAQFVASIFLSMPLGNFTSVSAGADYDGDRPGGDFRLRRSPPVAGGFGYHARVAVDGVERYEAGAQYRTRYGDIAADFSRVDGAEAGRFSLRGGAAVVAGKAFLAPSVTDSVAVVTIGEEAGVRVYHDRQLIGETDRDGKVVISRLRAFERNDISFEPADVSLGADFESAETTVTPGFRTGHQVAFEVARGVNVVARIVHSGGRPPAAGRSMTDVRTGRAYVVGRNGKIYVPAMRNGMRLRYEEGDAACEAEISLPPMEAGAPYHDIGEIECVRAGQEI